MMTEPLLSVKVNSARRLLVGSSICLIVAAAPYLLWTTHCWATRSERLIQVGFAGQYLPCAEPNWFPMVRAATSIANLLGILLLLLLAARRARKAMSSLGNLTWVTLLALLHSIVASYTIAALLGMAL